jgi:hypothetical protein
MTPGEDKPLGEDKPPRATGRCLCGAVRYQIRGPLRAVVNCHCGQCRRTHGNVAAYTSAARADLVLTEDRGLKWYRSSEIARRGFCRDCGASLFWERLSGDQVAVAAGSIDPPSGLKTIQHIFVADKGDYYEIADGLETLPTGRDD